MQSNEKWVRDTSIIFSLVFLLLAYNGYAWALTVSALLLLSLLVFPRALWPLGYAWFLIANLLGRILNKIFLTAVFFLIITPIAYIRRFLVGDTRDFSFHKGKASGFIDRGGNVTCAHMQKPY